MKTSISLVSEPVFVPLTHEECLLTTGGSWVLLPHFIAIGAIAGAALAIFELGKATGDFIYQVTH